MVGRRGHRPATTAADTVKVNKGAYVGQPVDEVRADLEDKGLETKVETEENPGDEEAGTVADLSPTGVVDKGEVITLQVWDDPPAPETEEPQNEEPDEDGEAREDQGAETREDREAGRRRDGRGPGANPGEDPGGENPGDGNGPTDELTGDGAAVGPGRGS